MEQKSLRRENGIFSAIRNPVWIVCVLLILAVAAAFGRAIRYDFVNYDDGDYVAQNPAVLNGLTASGVLWAFTNNHVQMWIPATWLSLMADAQFYGNDARGYHLTNLLLHAATVVGLFLVLRRMTGRTWPSAIVAALFAVHPLRVESVAWVTERKDVLSGLFFVLTLGAYVGYVRRPSRAKYAIMALCFAVGLMAKPVLITLPCVLLLLDYWPLRRFSPCADRGRTDSLPPPEEGGAVRRLVAEKIPLFLLAAIACAVTYKTQGRSMAHNDEFPFLWRIGNAAISYVAYLSQFFWPVNLSVSYPRRPLNLPVWEVWGSLTLIVAVTAAAFAFRRRHPYWLVGWLWYLGMFLPVIGLLQIGVGGGGDRFTYLPQIGIAMALAWGLADLCAEQPRRCLAAGAASGVVLLTLTACAWRQTAYWHDSETLWRRALACNEHDSFAQGGLGTMLHRVGRIDEAILHYQKAVALQPDDVVYNNLGGIYAERHQYDKAVACWENVLKITPDFAKAHVNLGHVLADRGELDKAIWHFRQALASEPDNADAHSRLGDALHRQGKDAEAVAPWRMAIQLTPTNLGYVRQMALLLATSPDASVRSGKESLELAIWAVQLSGGKASIDHSTLAAAYAETGRFAQAVDSAKKALALAAHEKNAALVELLRSQLRLYESKKPYRSKRGRS
jgi:protein O-mannosyl-transferase